MDIQTKLNTILQLQEQNLTIAEIAFKLETTEKGIRSFMGRQNYKCKNGFFTIKPEFNEQLSLTESLGLTTNNNINVKTQTRNKPIVEEEVDPRVKLAFVATTTDKPGKLELTPEFLDMIYELRDWYLNVKELPQLKPKINKKNRTVNKEDILIEEPFSKRIQTDKNLWEDLTRLSENSGVEVNELVTQAIKNLLKDYKHLI